MKTAIYHLRLIGFLLLLAGSMLLLRNLLLSYQNFNPSYLGHYFKQELSSPVLLLLAGFGMRIGTKPIARGLTKDTED